MTVSRLIAYTPNGASLGPLPTPEDYQASFVFNDVGGLSLNYPLDAPRSSLLGTPIEVALEVSQDGGQTYTEPPDARFLYLRDGRDRVKRDAYAVECPSYAWMLSKALVPPTGLDATGNRTFTNALDGAILRTLLDEAKARGWGAGLSMDFTATTDSAGRPWNAAAQTISYEPGRNLLSILQELAELGRILWRMEGRTLRVFGEASAQNTNPMNTVQANVDLVYGRDLTEAPFRRTWEGLAGVVFVVGDQAKVRTVTNASATAPWGRWEAYASASGVSDEPTLDLIGQAVLSTTATERAEHTFGVVFSASPYRPFRDYQVGHWVNVLVENQRQSMRVRQVTLTRDASGEFGGNLVLNDKFLEADVLAARRIADLTGAASGGTAGTPSGPTANGNDILAPGQVTGLAATSSHYLDGATPRAQVSLDWADVTTNADGTAASDVARYETWYRTSTTGTWLLGTSTTVSNSAMSGFTPNQYLEFRVRAVDTVGNEGAWSSVVTLTAARDNTPPATPATPSATSRLGTARVAWSGLNSVGAAMDADLAYVEVHLSTVSGFTPDTGTLTDTLPVDGGAITAGPLTYGTPYYFRLVAVDRQGNKSTASAQATTTVAPLVDVSNFPDDAMTTLYARTGKFLDLSADNFAANLIEGQWLKAGTVQAEKLAISDLNDYVRDPSMRALGTWGFSDAAAWRYQSSYPFSNGSPQHLQHIGSSYPGGTYTASEAQFPVTAGDQFRLTALTRKQGGTATGGTVIFRLYFYDHAGAPAQAAGYYRETTRTAASYATSSVVPLEFDVTIPNGVAFAQVQLIVTALAVPAGTTWWMDWDEVHALRRIPDAQITSISPGKITTGILAATTKIVAGAAQDSGPRVELSQAGINLFSSVKNTVRLDAATGNATFLGEVGTAEPGQVGIFMFSTTFSYAGAQVTRPVLQMNVAKTRDQPSIQASTVGSLGMLVYSGANTGELESCLSAEAGRIYEWIENAADSGAVGSYTELTNTQWRSQINGGSHIYLTASSFRASPLTGGYVDVGDDVTLQTKANRYGQFEGSFYSRPAAGTADAYLIAGMTNTGNMQGMRVNLGVSVRFGAGTSAFEFVSGDGSNWRACKASAFQVQSDRKAKRGVKAPARAALDVLRAAPTYEWEYAVDDADKDPRGRQRRRVGPLAEDLPDEFLAPGDDGHDPDHFAKGTYMVDLHQLLATAVQAIQELDAEMDAAPWRSGRVPQRKALTL